MFNPTNEVALDTLDLGDLVLQFKLMRKMGYKSLFDPEFRRELKNPYRKHLYYKIMLSEEAMENNRYFDIAKFTSDKISFFTDPELFNKVRKREEEEELADPEKHAEKEKELLKKYGRPEKHLSSEEQQRDIEVLKKAKPTRSMG